MKRNSLVVVCRGLAEDARRFYDVYIMDNECEKVVIPKYGIFNNLVKNIRTRLGLTQRKDASKYVMKFVDFVTFIRSRWTLNDKGYVIPVCYETMLMERNPKMVFEKVHYRVVISEKFIISVLNGEYEPIKTNTMGILRDTQNAIQKLQEASEAAIRHTDEYADSAKIVKGMQYAAKEMYIKDVNGEFTKVRVIGYCKYNGTDYQFAVLVKDSQGNKKIRMVDTIYDYKCVPTYQVVHI